MYTSEDLKKANAEIAKTPIGKKDYAEVNQRIKAFRSICPNGKIFTEMTSNENGVCIFRASVFDDENRLLGTGTAYEKEGSTFINKTSYIENCETSAVGRALGMCGFGVDTSIASAEEVANAIANQNGDQKPEEDEKQKKIYIDTISKLLSDTGIDGVQMIEYVNEKFNTSAQAWAELNIEQLIFTMRKLDDRKAKDEKKAKATK